MERATGMMLEIDDTDNPEKESFRRDPSGRFGRREAGCERVTRVLVANEPRSYRQAIAAALQVITAGDKTGYGGTCRRAGTS